MAKRTAPRETLLYGKKYHRGVSPQQAGVVLVELLTLSDRVDVRDKSLVVIGGEEHVRTEVVYYQKVRPVPDVAGIKNALIENVTRSRND